MTHFADRLLAATADKAPICVGLDPVLERLPAMVLDEAGVARHEGKVMAPASLHDLETAIEAMEIFCRGVLWSCAETAGVVKLQSACFERYHAAGVDLFDRIATEARRLGMLVIADAKRGDIGISSSHYAAAAFAPLRGRDEVAGADALTVSPYLGRDALEPFVQSAAEHAAGLFVLVRTSNPGGDDLQSLKLADGRRVVDQVAALVAELGAGHVGSCGYSLVGAVVGATRPGEVRRLREQMPGQLFLVPGYGAQGGGADDVRDCFDAKGHGALITASRSILYAFESTDTDDWTQPVEAACRQFSDEISGILAR